MINVAIITPEALDDIIQKVMQSSDVETLPFGILRGENPYTLSAGIMEFKSDFSYVNGTPMLKSYIEFPIHQSISVSTILERAPLMEILEQAPLMEILEQAPLMEILERASLMETVIFVPGKGATKKQYGPVIHDDLQAAMTYHNLITIRLVETVARVCSN